MPGTRAAALAYFAIFALAPVFLVILLALDRLVGAGVLEARLVAEVTRIAGPTVSGFVRLLMSSARTPSSALVPGIVGIVAVVYGAIAVFEEATRSLNAIWKSAAPGEHSSYVGSKIFSFFVMMGLIVLLLVSFSLAFMISALRRWLETRVPGASIATGVATVALTWAEVWFFSALAYRYLPRSFVSWRAALSGGFVASALFMLGRFLAGLYITAHAVLSGYGAVGAVIIVLVWFYYSAHSFLFGASVAYCRDYCNRPQEG